MLVRRDERRGAFRRDVRTLGDVRRVERAVRDVERHAPVLHRNDRGLTCSAGEVGVGSGGSGEGRARECRMQNAECEKDEQTNSAFSILHSAFHLAFSSASSISSHIPPVTAPTNFPFGAYTRTYGSAAAPSDVACRAAALFHLPMLTRRRAMFGCAAM